MIFFSNFGFRGFKDLNIFQNANKNPENFVNSQDTSINIFQEFQADKFESSVKRINDYDSNILDKNLVQFVASDSLRIELKLEKAETELKDVESEIKVNELFSLDVEGKKLAELNERKKKLEKEIEEYRLSYRDLGIIYKISDMFVGTYDNAKDKLNEYKLAFCSHPVVKKLKRHIPGINKKEEMSFALEKMCTLNSSLNNMLAKTVNPFGESDIYFTGFVKALTEANKLDKQTDTLFSSPQKPVAKIKVKVLNLYNDCKTKSLEFINKLKEKSLFNLFKKSESTENVS